MHLNGSRVISSTEDVRRKGCLSEQSRRNCEGKIRRNNFKQLESAFATIDSIEEEPEDNREETEDDEKNAILDGCSTVDSKLDYDGIGWHSMVLHGTRWYFAIE